jgi:2-oxoglutarate ferredoxin oxidoreductase subunit beta
MLRGAFQTQLDGAGFSLVEILKMCPTGWFVPAADGPRYQAESMEQTYPLGELRTP